METWCRIYNGGDLEDVVRDCTECDVFKNFTENLQDGIPFSVTPDYKPCAFSSSKSQGSHKFMTAHTKQEPAGSENMATIESPSSASLDLKFPTRDNNSTQLVERCSPATKTDSNGNNSTKLPARAKRRKSEERRVMRVPMAEGSWNKQGGAGVPSDLWSWRKYGQKPIKGSPYPRGYYRCSSSKGCPARKHIERSRTDPTMLLITYSADHNHVWNWSSHRHARSSRQNSFLDKTVQAWSVPKSTADAPNDDGVSPHMTDKCEPNSHFQDNSLDAEDQYSGVDVLGANHILDDNYYFADLGELPELYPKDSIRYSGEEDVNSMFDPFNLFDWSSSANQTCSIHDLNYPTCY